MFQDLWLCCKYGYIYPIFHILLNLSAGFFIAERPISGLFNRQPVKQPAQLPGRNEPHFGLAVRPMEPVPLQPLVPQAEAVSVPIEQLDRVSFAIAEAEQVTGQRILTQLFRRQHSQGVNRFAHIGDAAGQIRPKPAGPGHRRRSSAPRTATRAAGSK